MLAAAPIGCVDGTRSSIQIDVTGDGRVYSTDGTFDCTARGGTCAMSFPVAADADQSSSSYHLIAEPAAAGGVTEWNFVVAADCPNCDSADPEMGAIDVRGDHADVRIDMNPGYDVTETISVTFGTTPPGPASAPRVTKRFLAVPR